MATLAVIVPATDAPPTLAACLAAIGAGDGSPDELVVVAEPPWSGPAAARNAGAGQTSAEVLVFVDADVLVHGDALARIRSAFVADPGLAALFGSYDDRPAAAGIVSEFRNLLHHWVHQQGAGPATTFWAGLGAVRRGAFEAAGGFDAARFPRPSVEDVELGARLAATGARIVLDPELLGTHLKRWTLPEMLRVDLARRGAPWVALLLRSGSGTTALNLGRRHRLSALASVGVAAGLVRRRRAPATLGVAALLVLNRDFYALLARRLGPGGAAAGVALHVVHHLTAVLSVPAGVALHVRERLREQGKT